MEKVYVNPDHSSQLLAQISMLWKRDKYCDAALNLGTTRYKLHKLVLVASCPDIMRLLLHTEENNVFDFYVPSGHDRSVVESVLRYLYEGVIQLTQANVNGIDAFSQTLQLESLIKFCIHYKTWLRNDNGEQVFHAPDSMQMSDDSPTQDCAYNISMISSGNLSVPRQSIQETVETRNPFCVLGVPEPNIMQDGINCQPISLLNTVPNSVKSESDSSDIEILQDTQTDLIMSVTAGENENFSIGSADFEQIPSSNNGQLTLNTDTVREDFTPYSSSNLISTQGESITDHPINQDEITTSSSFQRKPAHGASGFMEVLPVDSILKQYSDKNSKSVTVFTGNDSVKNNVSEQKLQNSDQSASTLDKTAVYFPETDARCEDEEQTGSSTFIMVSESMSARVKDKGKVPESNLRDSHHTDPGLEAPPSYQGSDLHHGMQVGSGSDNSIQNCAKKNSMSTHSVQCSLDDSEEDIDMEAESDLEEMSAHSAKINRCFPRCSQRLVLPNSGTSLTVLKQCLKENKLPLDIEIDIVGEESVGDSMILDEITKSPHHPGSTTNIVSSEPYVDMAFVGKVTQAGTGSQALPNSQVNKLWGPQRQPESEKKKALPNSQDNKLRGCQRQPESEKKKVAEPKRPYGGSNKEMSGQPVTLGKPDSGQWDKVGQAAQTGQLCRLRKSNNGWVREKQLRSKEKIIPPDVYQAKEKKFRCAECQKCFESQTGLCSHKIIHQLRYFKCKICKGTFHKIFLFSAHLKMHRSRGYFITFGKESKFKCSICGNLFETMKGLESHLVVHSQNGELIPKKTNVKFECEICGKELENSFNYETHLDKHKKMKKVAKDVHIFECLICGRDILHLHNYELHLYKHQNDKDI